jgi:hypothetical protein
MKKERFLSICCFVAVLMLFITPFAVADTLTSTTAGDVWQNWTSGDLDRDGKPYWDNASWDGTNKNIGYYLSNSGAFSGSTDGPGSIPFWGALYNANNDTGGGFDPNFYFVKDSVESLAAMEIEIAGYAPYNTFGWYDTTMSFGGSNIHIIFDGAASSSASTYFTPSLNYGFYLWSPQNGGEYFLTESSKSSVDQGYQHFAVFQEPVSDTYWIGMEDLKFGKIPGRCGYYDSDKDYNDMVVKISPVPAVPEPTTMILLGLGLIGLAGIRRKFQI